ncbi:LPD1 domain-containing protein [Clostridium sp. MT-14]|uniref:LPD1 domain-containing protein n=1 Tax=unclassified Clostridium TaxID=2614128 RepID=UPI00123C7937|nr:LPD1 domain-containing protein [Clostridium sp. HV4-5-A1G]KAA8668348.1 hypothetical protein F3O63_14715 [Clostridium sp. HV4-5-A1G]
MKIEDFGEKIGGAKKDLWKERNFLISDLDSLSDREAFQFCVKDQIWKKPDYREMCNDNPKLVVFCIKKLRDALPAKVKPTHDEEENKNNRKLFVEFVSIVRDVAMNLKSEEDLKNVFYEIFVRNGYYRQSWTGKVYKNPNIKNKFTTVAYKVSQYPEDFRKELSRIGFPDSLSQKNPLIVKEQKGKFFICKSSCKSSKYYYKIVCKSSFETREEAELYIENMNKKGSSIFKFQRPVLKGIERRGPAKRKFEVSTDEFLEIFGFRGGEFGNYATDSERQMHINYCFDALVDLAYVLNVASNFISLKREGESSLGIAFGARGSGNASAHYESCRRVINITKIRGAGSLSHEWLHALDDFIGSICENEVSYPYASFNINNSNKLSPELLKVFKDLIYSLKYKNESGNAKQSDFLIESRKLDEGRKKDYFSTIQEMFARAFEAYVQDSLREKGFISQYLVHGVDNKYYFSNKPYPEGEERKEFNKKFKALFIELKKFLSIPDFEIPEVYNSQSTHSVIMDISTEIINGKQLSLF